MATCWFFVLVHSPFIRFYLVFVAERKKEWKRERKSEREKERVKEREKEEETTETKCLHFNCLFLSLSLSLSLSLFIRFSSFDLILVLLSLSTNTERKNERAKEGTKERKVKKNIYLASSVVLTYQSNRGKIVSVFPCQKNSLFVCIFSPNFFFGFSFHVSGFALPLFSLFAFSSPPSSSSSSCSSFFPLFLVSTLSSCACVETYSSSFCLTPPLPIASRCDNQRIQLNLFKFQFAVFFLILSSDYYYLNMKQISPPFFSHLNVNFGTMIIMNIHITWFPYAEFVYQKDGNLFLFSFSEMFLIFHFVYCIFFLFGIVYWYSSNHYSINSSILLLLLSFFCIIRQMFWTCEQIENNKF